MNNQNSNPQHTQPAQQMPPIPQSKSGMAIAGFVLGIIALLTSFLPIINNFSFFLAILGLIFGIVGMVGISKGKKSGKGLAIAVIVICVVSGAVVLGTQSMYSAALDSATSSAATTPTSASSTASTESTAASNSTSGGSSAANSSVSAEYRNALAKAQQYSDMMHMSKQGIYDQLLLNMARSSLPMPPSTPSITLKPIGMRMRLKRQSCIRIKEACPNPLSTISSPLSTVNSSRKAKQITLLPICDEGFF